MSCSYCGSQYCTGNCLNAGINGSLVIGNNPSFTLQGQAAQAYIPAAMGNINWIPNAAMVDTSMQNFLDIIADKSDSEACVAFVEQQLKIRATQAQELERLKQQHQQIIESTEKDFLSKCGKYRPTITSEIMERVKKLKAFF